MPTPARLSCDFQCFDSSPQSATSFFMLHHNKSLYTTRFSGWSDITYSMGTLRDLSLLPIILMIWIHLLTHMHLLLLSLRALSSYLVLTTSRAFTWRWFDLMKLTYLSNVHSYKYLNRNLNLRYSRLHAPQYTHNKSLLSCRVRNTYLIYLYFRDTIMWEHP